jgi:capsular exopolysaccharide synthesis family protein
MEVNRRVNPSPAGELVVPRNGHRFAKNGSVNLVSFEALQDTPGQAESDTSIIDTIQLLRARLWIIVLITMVGAAAGGALTLLQPPIYHANTTMELRRPTDTVFGFQGTAPAPYQPQSYVETQIKVLESHTLRSRVIASLTATNKLSAYTPPDRLAAWRKVLGLPVELAKQAHRIAVPQFELKVRGFENTDVIEIACDSPDPQFSADYANTMAEEFIQLSLDSRWATYQRTNKWMSHQLEDIKAKLEQSERDLQAYSARSGLLFTDQKDSVQSEKLKQVQAELSRAEADRVEKQSTFEIAMASSADSVGQVIDNDRLSGYQTKLTEMRRQLAELNAAYTPEHYRVIRIKAEIAEVEGTFERERQAILRRIRNDYEGARRRESLLQSAYESMAQAVSAQDAKAIHYDVLKRDVDTDRQLYDTLLQKVKEAGVASALSTSNMNVLDAAEPPMRPYKPSITANILKGIGGGLLCALFLVVSADRINRSLRAPGEAPFHLKVPELGVIPACDGLTRGSFSSSRKSKSTRLLSLNPDDGLGERVELITWQNSNSILAESFRNTLASILLSGEAGRPKVILVTSASREEGKSTTVSNLGIGLAEINHRILLIDADMRKPRLHHIFELSNSWGLSDLLREKTALRDSPLEALARPTQIAGMWVLPSGPGTVSISNLLYSERMAQLLERFRSEFDTILIDTPPMLVTSDARILGRLADGAALVIRAGKTTRDQALCAKQRMIEDGVPVLGTILNGWDSRSKSRYGSPDYGHYSPNS